MKFERMRVYSVDNVFTTVTVSVYFCIFLERLFFFFNSKNSGEDPLSAPSPVTGLWVPACAEMGSWPVLLQ